MDTYTKQNHSFDTCDLILWAGSSESDSRGGTVTTLSSPSHSVKGSYPSQGGPCTGQDPPLFSLFQTHTDLWQRAPGQRDSPSTQHTRPAPTNSCQILLGITHLSKTRLPMLLQNLQQLLCRVCCSPHWCQFKHLSLVPRVLGHGMRTGQQLFAQLLTL